MIISKTNKSILVPFDKVSALWPTAPTMAYNGGTYAVLPHTPQTQIRLRAVEIEAPAPILSYYGWPAADGLKPFYIQKQTAALISSQQRSFVLNDMGTGKTRSSLWAWHYLRSIGAAHKLLVVAPLSTLKFVWWRELSYMFPNIKVAVLHGLKQKRLNLLAGDYDVYVINHDGLKTIVNQVYERADIDFLILDELAVYRNNSMRSKQMRAFAARFTWVTGMTGRPMPNAPTDCWAQCKIIVPQRTDIPKYFTHAQTRLMVKVNDFKWIPKPEALQTAYGWMQPSVRFTLDDVVELPEAIYRTMQVEMSPEQSEAYATLSNEFTVLVREKRITAVNAGVALGKLLQVGCGYVYTNNPQYVTLDSKPRQDTLLQIIDEAPGKLIVYAPWRHLIDNLSKLLTENEIEHAVVHGDTAKREEIFNAFQNTPRYRVLLAHPQTVHHGITLTAATTSVWYSPITSLEVHEQAEARIRRIGQNQKQLFLSLQATPVESKVYALLRRKQKLQEQFLELLETALEPQTSETSHAKAESRRETTA